MFQFELLIDILIFIDTATPSGAATERTLSEAKVTGEGTGDVTVWMKGFFFPKANSSYQFTYSTNGQAKLFISTDASSANKALVANGGMVNLEADT